MKFYKLLFLLVTTIISTQSSARGGDSSAGGGGLGGSLSLTSRFSDHEFSVYVSSNHEGIIATVLRYYLLAGAVRQESATMVWYSVPGNEGHSIVAAKPSTPPSAEPPLAELQLDFRIAFADLLDNRSGCDASCVSTIAFRGSLANLLYAGMEASNLVADGHTLDNSGRVFGNIYNDGAIGCEKSPRFGTSCTFNVPLE